MSINWLNAAPDAEILIYRHTIPLRGEYYHHYTYEWRGGEIAWINWAFDPGFDINCLEDGQVFRLGLFLKLRVISCRPWQGIYVVMREGGRATLIYHLGRIFWRLDLFYRRLIIAASVFNLAICNPAEVPSWRDLKWFRMNGREIY